ncbi:MAG TPA: LPS export ABC transporter periplasmic protein LptC [Candidatus Acidoferrales bacterium]|nr:LPS export ABC transporter periplasmic protein LptC [Candidatus Acidoferrales bacterium]
MKRIAVALGVAFVLVAATPKPSASPSPPQSPSGSPSGSPSALPSTGPDTFQVGVWTVHASLVDVNFKTGDFSTPKQVTMTRGGGDITADRASGNYKSSSATLYGHVVMHDTEGNFAGLSSTKPAKSKGPSTLTADQVHIDGKGKIYTATGNVHYVQADTTVDSETGVLDDLTHDLDLKGNVRIVQGARNMLADHVLYNTVSGQAHAEGDVVMQFPSDVSKTVATPRPIHVPLPFERHHHENESPAPSPSSSP